MEIKSTLATQIINGMTQDFLELSGETDKLSIEEFAHCVLYSLKDNLSKQGLIHAEEVDEMGWELKLHLMTCLHIETRAEKAAKNEGDTLSTYLQTVSTVLH